ncbi:MAG: hypothetical protein ACW99Q_03535, partial [Candidatus Kariarchaeaceae archaeon]
MGFDPIRNEEINSYSSIEDISQLLYAAQGITHFPFRSVPSAGGTYPLDVYVLANDISQTGILGINHFDPFEHSITQSYKADYGMLNLTLSASSEDVEISKTLFVFIITAEFSRTTTKYGNRGIGYV